MKLKLTLKFAIAQMNPTVGDFPANEAKIKNWIAEAEHAGADWIVFPELALCGYPVWDLANKTSFVEAGLRSLKKLIAATKNRSVHVVLGYINQNQENRGRSFNALAVIHKGKLAGTYHKRLLPTYDVFLENIFFAQGQKSLIRKDKGMNFGFTICEDIWDEAYETKPVRELARDGADFIVNISASPFYRGVLNRRLDVLRRHACQHRIPMLYVNQVGAQDDLIFDGRSVAIDSQGRLLFQAPAFQEGLFYFDWNPSSRPLGAQDDASSDVQEMYQALTLGVRDYCRKNGFKKVVLGLSGGIDSALVAAIAADALGSDAVTGLTMPGLYSSEGSWKDALELAKRLGISCYSHPIRDIYQSVLGEYKKHYEAGDIPFPEAGKISLAMENLQARLRGLALMFVSNDQGRLLLTTGNKSELAMGYCTLYGDMAGGLAVIADLYKTDVYRLARYRNSISPVIPENSLTKAPSAELRPDQKDEDALPPYEILDQILYHYIEKNLGIQEIVGKLKKSGVSRETVYEVIRKVDHNEYKRRQTAPVLRVTEKAWFGRRMPITNHFFG